LIQRSIRYDFQRSVSIEPTTDLLESWQNCLRVGTPADIQSVDDKLLEEHRPGFAGFEQEHCDRLALVEGKAADPQAVDRPGIRPCLPILQGESAVVRVDLARSSADYPSFAPGSCFSGDCEEVDLRWPGSRRVE
jgi:hypothetical protein